MTEIFDLKNFISSIYSAIPSNYENPIKHDEQADQEQENPNESIESIIELPFENIHSRLNHKFQSKFKLINNVLNNISNREQSIEDVNNSILSKRISVDCVYKFNSNLTLPVSFSILNNLPSVDDV